MANSVEFTKFQTRHCNNGSANYVRGRDTAWNTAFATLSELAPRQKKVGNLRRQSFEEIWYGSEIAA